MNAGTAIRSTLRMTSRTRSLRSVNATLDMPERAMTTPHFFLGKDIFNCKLRKEIWQPYKKTNCEQSIVALC